ncbi:alpha-2-macroglobulin family protein [Aquabacterium sp.]|uniref:alpha-2-macroglobulin family protein n=1 Tax=Aquabacterium sp. TaxID=1872578 RepID=UPI002BA0801B|nr:MG2 domain-containing protein [Aquabacterium sp.]HSW04238.1 MG2 domain-containing protein [Aquabacterium sp.]
MLSSGTAARRHIHAVIAGFIIGLLACVGLAGPARAARITGVTPQGEVAQVRQVVVRFGEAVVPLGDPNRQPPLKLACSGPVPASSTRWNNAREWLIDFTSPVPPGVRCSLSAVPGWAPLQGTLEGNTDFSFATGGPAIERSDPWDGNTVEEDQHFLLRLTGPATADSIAAHAWCEVDGIGERIAVQQVTGAVREQVLKARRVRAAEAARSVLLACARPLPPQTKLRLVWGAGIASAADPGVLTRAPQRLRFEVRSRFTAEFSCEREKAQAPCMPLAAAIVRFSAPVPRKALESARLLPAEGKEIAPKLSGDEQELSEVRFTSPLPDNTKFRLVLPADLKDVSGRALSNASSFPLAINTGPMPPIAKFAAAPFGIIELGPDAMLPITLRHVQPELRTGAVRIKKIDERDWLSWMGRLASAQDKEFESRKTPLLARQPDVKRLDLPQLQGGDPRPFEVVGIPLTEPGYHVVEIESTVLGERLLATRAPMFVRTGVLVTNLGVHVKRSPDNAQVWVTTLDRAQAVANAAVAVHDCRGKLLWEGRTDASGLATVPMALPEAPEEAKCSWQRGHYVTASTLSTVSTGAQGQPLRDTAFAFSSWNRGIEPWRFNMPIASADDSRGSDRLRMHTVFDRMLLRAGETVSMKHLVRQETRSGLVNAERGKLPTEMKIVHVGSGDEQLQPLTFDASGRAALASWQVPPTAKLGLYQVSLKNAQREWTSGSFRVEAFRLPLIDARLVPPKSEPIAPSEVALALQLTHLSGGGVARAPVRASALMRDRFLSFPGYESFSFEAPRDPAQRDGDRDGEEGSQADRAKLVVDKQALSTDANGAATVALKGLPKITRPAELQAELSFNDPNGEVQTVSTRVPLWPAARVVGLRAGSWAASVGKVKFQALVLDLKGKPLVDAKLQVQARVTQWQANRKRLVGGFYAYDQQAVQKDLGQVCEGKSDARGMVLCEAALSAAGEVELIARSADEAGRSAEAATTVWVTRQGELWFEQDNDDRIDVLADKPGYAPGDTAKLQVRMPYRQATALVSIEREGIISSKVVQLQGDDPTVEVTIPKTAGDSGATSWAPNVFASVLVLRGRVRHVPWYSFFSWGWRSPGDWWRAFRFEGREYQAPTAMVDLAKPSHKFGVVQLHVGLDAHKLEVKVTADQPQYAVRQKVKAKVQVLQNGKPAAGAEIAFAAVDEALLALMGNSSWNLLEAMFQPRGWAVETATAHSEIIGRRHYGRKAVPAGGGGGRNPTRELFDTLLLWRGSISLDANGEATIEVPLNDSLTSFRLVALASAGADRFGTGSTSVRVTQDLQMLPGLPPLAREGDRFDAIFTLRNTTAREIQVEATLAATAQRDEGAGITRTPMPFAPQRLTLPAGAAAEVKWPVEVPTGAFSLAYEAAAMQTGGSAQDRVKLTQLVKPAVPVRVWAASLQQLDGTLSVPPHDGTLSMPVAPPPDALPLTGAKSGGIQIGLQPTLAGALPGIRRFFETYPFSCLEQQASKALALKDGKAWAQLGHALPGYLDADGLALYYPPREGDPPRGSDRLTAYLIAAAHEANQPLPDAARERMLLALQAFVEGRLLRDSWSAPSARGIDLDVRKLAAIEALSRHGRAAPQHLQSITVAPKHWPTAAVIDWLRILQRIEALPERAQRLQEAQTILRARLTYAGTTLKFSTEDSDFWWWLMDSADANAARLILAVVDDPAWKDELPRMVIGALGRQQRAAWLTTTANLWGVLALDRFAARFETAVVAGRSSATLGPASATHDWSTARQGGRLMLPWPTASAPLNVQHQGSGKPWLAVQALAAVPLKTPIAAGYRITRSVNAVERKDAAAWTRGDVLRVRIEIDAQSDMTWVALNDPVPAGATLLGSGLGRDSAIATQAERKQGTAWLAYEERGQEAFRASWEFMPRGKHVIEYTLRLNSAGRFHLPPSRVEAMYAPESFGEQPNAPLEVRP